MKKMVLSEVVCNAITGADAIKRAPIVNEKTGIKCLRIGDVSQRRDYRTWGYTKTSKEDFKRFKLEVDDIVVARTGNTIGVNCFIEDEIDSVFNNGLIRIKANTDLIMPRYLWYIISSLECQDYIQSIAFGTSTQPNMKIKDFLRFQFIYQSIEVQHKIIQIIDSIDQKIKNNRRINENLAQQIEAVLLSFIDDNDTDLVKLGDYLYIKGRIGWKGLKKSEYLSQSGYRIINGETLTKAGIDWSKAGYISKERYVESPEIMLKVGDILLSKDGTIGKIGYIDNLDLPTSVASGIFVIRNNKPDIISTTFIYYLLKSKLFESFIAARTEGSVIPHLYQKDFTEFEFPLPSAPKMAEFKEITGPMFSQIINNLNENKALASLRDSLLPKLISGELDVSGLDI